MVKVIDNHVVRSLEELCEEYVGSKILVILDNPDDVQNLRGYAYAVSDSIYSNEELYDMREGLEQKGYSIIVIGDYNEGLMAGIQYITKQ